MFHVERATVPSQTIANVSRGTLFSQAEGYEDLFHVEQHSRLTALQGVPRGTCI